VPAVHDANRGHIPDTAPIDYALGVRRARGEERGRVNPNRSDAVVFFGATGDLAFKQIFPALYAMTVRDQLLMPVISVARSAWTLERFRAHARRSVEQGGTVDEAAFAKLAARLQYVEGDYNGPDTYVALRGALGDTQRPLHYLAIPPAMFQSVAQ